MEDFGLSMDSFGTIDNLFLENEENVQEELTDPLENEGVKDENEELPKEDIDSLFVNEQENKENEVTEEDTESEGEDKETDSSPKSGIYQALSEALVEDGILPDISLDEIKDVKDAKTLSEIIQKQIELKLDDTQKRINEALSAGVEPDDIKYYENVINNLSSINEDLLEDESDKGEQLRKNLIYADYINRGFSEARAQKEVEKSIKAGNDIEDAKEALTSNKEFYSKKYNDVVEEAKKEHQAFIKSQEEQVKKLDEVINKTDEPFEGIRINNVLKKKISDNLKKPVYKDEDGRSYNAIQEYAKKNPVDYNYKLAVLFTMTDGFKNIENISKPVVNKSKKEHISALERKLSGMNYTNTGSVDFSEFNDKESFILA